MIDLHMHSTFSDGSLTPSELVAMAVSRNLAAIALTDHDTTGGVPELLEAGQRAGLRVIPGVEISVDFQPGTMHVLGYFLQAGNGPLEDALSLIREGRTDRNGQILAKLRKFGVDLTMEEVSSYAGEDVVARPHIAQAMVAKGYVKNNQEAFDRYLAKGKPGYCDRYRLEPEQGISLIRGAGGVPVLAHPSTVEKKPAELRALVEQLKAAGLQGIEASYSEHSPEQERRYQQLARSLDLVPTGGSDFHGANNPQIRMGTGFGSLHVSDEIADELFARSGC